MKRKKPGCKGFDLDYKSIGEEYLSGAKLKELAGKYNVSVWTLLDRFSKIGIKKHIDRFENENVFNSFTPESCYWGGFLAADGCIRKYSMGCQLAIVDINHLEKLKLFLQSNAKITETIKIKKNKEFKYCNIHFYNNKLVGILKENFNLIPKKSLVLLPPDKIPKELAKHYIRGYIDGDGSIGWHKHNRKIRLDICSGSRKILDWIHFNIKKNIESVGNPEILLVKDKNLYTIGYMGNQAKIILDWLYFDTNIYLDRKFEKFQSCKEKLKIIEKEKEIKSQNKKEIINKMVELYNNKYTYEDIANELNLTYGFVRYNLSNIDLGVKRTKSETRYGKKINERNEEIIKLFNEGVSAKELGEKYLISKDTIWKVVKESKGA